MLGFVPLALEPSAWLAVNVHWYMDWIHDPQVKRMVQLLDMDGDQSIEFAEFR